MEANCTTAVLKKPNIYRKNFKAHNTVTLLSLIKMTTGDAGDRTPCLSHAKRALYQLRYNPMSIGSY
jgi:hypothetical protein